MGGGGGGGGGRGPVGTSPCRCRGEPDDVPRTLFNLPQKSLYLFCLLLSDCSNYKV